MKKIFILIILIVSFFYNVLNVYAENTVINDISIKETGGSIYTEEPSVNEDLVQAKTVFKELNDSVTYQISLKFDYALYKIDSVTDSNNNSNVSTSYSYQNDKVFMTFTYNDEITSSLSMDDINVQVTLTDTFENPGTGNDYTMLYLCFMIMGILTFCIVYNKKKELIILLFLFVPFLVYAKDNHVLEFTFSGSQIGVGYEVTFYRDNDVIGDLESIGCFYDSNCEIPLESFTKEEKYVAGWATSDGGEIVYDAEGISLDFSSFASNNITLYPIWEDRVLNYDYIGTSVSYKILKSGSYKLEVWGAQGGDCYGNGIDVHDVGGRGGYSTGVISLAKGTLLYILVGGQGESFVYRAERGGGFNGGGNARNLVNNYSYFSSGGGGGATDIRVGTNSLYSRVIVAGGGGGAANGGSFSGRITGVGGGVSGGDTFLTHEYTSGYKLATGATQTSGGIYGYFGNGLSDASSAENGSFGIGGVGHSDSNACSGGGGGWYGGAASTWGPGSGGSGYIYTSTTSSNYPSGCLLNSSYYLSEAETIAGSESFTSPSGEEETGHPGNGYARITFLGD